MWGEAGATSTAAPSTPAPAAPAGEGPVSRHGQPSQRNRADAGALRPRRDRCGGSHGWGQGAWWTTCRGWLRTRVLAPPWFDRLVLAVVVANCVVLALDNPLDDPGSSLQQFIQVADKVRVVGSSKRLGLGLGAQWGVGRRVSPFRSARTAPTAPVRRAQYTCPA